MPVKQIVLLALGASAKHRQFLEDKEYDEDKECDEETQRTKIMKVVIDSRDKFKGFENWLFFRNRTRENEVEVGRRISKVEVDLRISDIGRVCKRRVNLLSHAGGEDFSIKTACKLMCFLANTKRVTNRPITSLFVEFFNIKYDRGKDWKIPKSPEIESKLSTVRELEVMRCHLSTAFGFINLTPTVETLYLSRVYLTGGILTVVRDTGPIEKDFERLSQASRDGSILPADRAKLLSKLAEIKCQELPTLVALPNLEEVCLHRIEASVVTAILESAGQPKCPKFRSFTLDTVEDLAQTPRFPPVVSLTTLCLKNVQTAVVQAALEGFGKTLENLTLDSIRISTGFVRQGLRFKHVTLRSVSSTIVLEVLYASQDTIENITLDSILDEGAAGLAEKMSQLRPTKASDITIIGTSFDWVQAFVPKDGAAQVLTLRQIRFYTQEEIRKKEEAGMQRRKMAEADSGSERSYQSASRLRHETEKVDTGREASEIHSSDFGPQPHKLPRRLDSFIRLSMDLPMLQSFQDQIESENTLVQSDRRYQRPKIQPHAGPKTDFRLLVEEKELDDILRLKEVYKHFVFPSEKVTVVVTSTKKIDEKNWRPVLGSIWKDHKVLVKCELEAKKDEIKAKRR